jgi:hypothetical protein
MPERPVPNPQPPDPAAVSKRRRQQTRLRAVLVAAARAMVGELADDGDASGLVAVVLKMRDGARHIYRVVPGHVPADE